MWPPSCAENHGRRRLLPRHPANPYLLQHQELAACRWLADRCSSRGLTSLTISLQITAGQWSALAEDSETGTEHAALALDHLLPTLLANLDPHTLPMHLHCDGTQACVASNSFSNAGMLCIGNSLLPAQHTMSVTLHAGVCILMRQVYDDIQCRCQQHCMQ